MTKKKPKSGDRLTLLSLIVEKIDAYIVDIVDNVDKNAPNELADFLKTIPDLFGYDPDAYKFILDGVERSRAISQNISDKEMHTAMMLEGVCDQLEGQITGEMKRVEVDAMIGDTWRFDLVKQPPRIEIDFTKLPQEYFQEVVQRVPRNAEILTDINDGMTIEGVTVHTSIGLQTSVMKKAVRA
jgi:hypothetical protein